MNKAEATKQSIKELLKERTALKSDDAMMIYGVLNKYGIESIKELDRRIKEKIGDEIPEKYKKAREQQDKLSKL